MIKRLEALAIALLLLAVCLFTPYSQAQTAADTGAYHSTSAVVTMIDAGPNTYSPHVQVIDGRRKIFSGGWRTAEQDHDTIGRADCPTPQHCDFEQTIVFEQRGLYVERPDGMALVNDPAVVAIGDHLTLFMTVCPEPNRCSTDSSTNEIWSAVSWAHDGLQWSSPVRILADAWLPSVVQRPDGDVWLYGNYGHDGALFYMSLGPAGANVSSRHLVNVLPAENYINVEVRYFAAANAYFMLGERNGAGVIDALVSPDGVNFHLWVANVAGPAGDYVDVRTPAMEPDGRYIYAAATKRRDGMGNQIFSMPVQP